MAKNNNLLFNAAVAGAMGGTLSGRGSGSATAANYLATVTAAAALATEIDSLIATDGTISGGGGVALPPSTAAITDAIASKTAAIAQITAASCAQTALSDATAADYATQAAAIVAAYTEALTVIVTG